MGEGRGAGGDARHIGGADDVRRTAEAAFSKKAESSGYAIQICKGRAEKLNADADSIDLITAFQAFHWFNSLQALQEFYRVLRPSGCLFMAWNDRDLSCNVITAVEDVIENANPQYSRKMKQNDL
mmetsp:Transcript_5754/g.19573  ORF Transcript_5754/g.19573 Transcript_5754/m.19573 type:complete len:125 (+) Transcript_5754:328-702(+)